MAKEYEKLEQWKKDEHEREGYTFDKTDFVAAAVRAARESGVEDPFFIRPFQNGDEFAVSSVICETLKISNADDYPAEFIKENTESHSPTVIAERAKDTHFYVICDGEKIIGCGGITGYWGRTTESYLVSVFVLPEYRGRGLGRRMIQTLENDEFFARAWRTEVGPSITAVDFYRRLGYQFKNGITAPDAFHVVRLEKIR